jgi:UDP-N-acetylglucosamine 2-epimerase (non-hydrolysing)
MKVFLVAGARPNFMKIAPIYRAAKAHEDVSCLIVHTGQHYDQDMSQVFFDDLAIPAPSFHLEAGSGSHAAQTARIMTAFEDVCGNEEPDLVMVVGDVNSTLACSIVAKKAGIRVAHVEAGLRSGDMSMPEEINRIVTDSISDYFFVTEESGVRNLLREGKSPDAVDFVGHVMIDNLLHEARRLTDGTSPPESLSTYALQQGAGKYAFLTLHRPSNVDNRETFGEIVSALNALAGEMKIFFPVHPRTRKMAERFGIPFSPNIVLLPPLGFRESLFLWKDAEVVLTDSGGLQEETTALGVPCVTLRENTERPVTVEIGTNVLAGTGREAIIDACAKSIGKAAKAGVPMLWDGRASERLWTAVRRRSGIHLASGKRENGPDRSGLSITRSGDGDD